LTIKAITFDFWQTLYSNKVIDYSKRLHQLKSEFEQVNGFNFELVHFEEAIRAARDGWNRSWVEDHRTMNAEEWLSIVQHRLDISLPPDYLLKIQTRMENSVLIERPILTSEARSVLADLSSRYRLGLISDTGITPGRVLRQILEADELTDYFTHLTFSDEVGRSKPHPDPFLTTLSALGAEPAEAVHIGDLLRTDIAGAQAVGMRGVQYIGLNHDDWPASTNETTANIITPDAVIRDHRELEPLLQGWNNDT